MKPWKLLLFFLCVASSAGAVNYSVNWTSCIVTPNIEGDTGTYTLTATVPNAGGSGNSNMNSGTQFEVQFQLGCFEARQVTGVTFQGIPVTLTFLTNNWLWFNIPVTVTENTVFSFTMHGISHPPNGNYTGGIKVWVVNNSSGMSTFQNGAFVIAPHIPAPVPGQGANRVPNHSFESITTCMSTTTGLCPVANCPPWYQPTNNGSSDAYHQCGGCSGGPNVPTNYMGYQHARSGGGYSGIYISGNNGPAEYREYMQAPLLCQLDSGQLYQVRMYVSSGDHASKAGDGFGIFFSRYPVTAPGIGPLIPVTPHISNPANNIISDTLNWTMIGGTFLADSDYTYITIGNFLTNANTNIINRPGDISEAYYYMDDIYVIPLLNITGNTNLCSGGNTTLTAPSGSSYLWNTGATTQSITVSPTTTTTYSITIPNGSCTDTASIMVNVTPGPTANITGNNTICSGSSTTLTASGGTNYVWDNSATTTTISVSPTATTTYTVTVSNGICSATATLTINVNPAGAASVSPASNPLCFGDANGSANIVMTGGTSPFTYLWSNSQTGQMASGLSSGTYTVMITDNNGCTATASVTITDPSALTLILTGNNSPCSGINGSVISTAGGGTAPFTYLWSNGATIQNISGLGSGTYTLTLTDNNGCALTQTASITAGSGPLAFAGGSTTINIGGSAPLTSSGGVSYVWFPANGLNCTSCQNPDASPTATTTYCVVVTDGSGCTDSACITVFVDNQCGELFVPNAFSPNNDGQNEMECVLGNCITELQFTIYDRWGEKVFETTDLAFCWDGMYRGKLLNTAVFVYQLNAVLSNGETISRKGNISLVR